MGITRRSFLTLATCAAAGAVVTLGGCSSDSSASDSSSSSDSSTAPTGSLSLDDTAWSYDSDNNVYWQIGLVYCEKPAAPEYESLGIYVPGAYLNGTENGDGTYTCTVNTSGAEGNWTAATAPIVMPVNTAGYSAQSAPTSYSYGSVSEYLQTGLIYVYAGCRGRDNGYANDGSLEFSGGAPWAVTDLKAAIRYLRYNDALLPGDKDAVFTFGHSGGGAQSAIMGATGDSELYRPYLESIGAALEDDSGTALSDAVFGTMCWCPITCLDEADAAYEWMMGQYADTGTRAAGTWTAAMSEDLSGAFADYINELGLKNEGETLGLESSTDGFYAAGSYYDYIRELIEQSLNNFLADTEFPYSPSSSTMADGGFGGGLGGGTPPDENTPGGGSESPNGTGGGGDMPGGSSEGGGGDMPGGNTGGGDMPGGGGGGGDAADGPSGGGGAGGGNMGGGDAAGGPSGGGGASSTTGSATYETAQDYIDALNGDEAWITYDADTNTATITNVGMFSRNCKMPSKDVGAFDATDRSQAENRVFGNDEENALHFDATMTHLLQDNIGRYEQLSNWDSTLPNAYADDRKLTDALGTDMDTRVGMYNPLYYLCSYYDGADTSAVAPHWRIRTGIEQSDTSLTVEANLALALQASSDVEDVDFATVWGQGHTTAERTGSSTTNFIEWIENCLK